MSAVPSRTRRRARRLGYLLGFALALGVVGLWLITVYHHPALLHRDWVAFDNAGWRALGGDWSVVYTASAEERWPYLYPPIALPLSLPLGVLPYWPSYLVCATSALGAMWWSCRRFHELVGDQAGRYLVFCAALLAAPTTTQVIVTGQYSWLYLLSLAALAAYGGGGAHGELGPNLIDQRRAGVWLVLLALKPNLAIFVALFLVVRGQWTLLARWFSAVVALVVVTAPFSLGAWSAFVDAVAAVAQRQEAGQAPVDKQITLLAFLRVLSGNLSASRWVWLLWGCLVTPLVVLACVVWYRHRHPGPAGALRRGMLRQVGLLALVMVAVNPRLYFYDGLVVAVAAAGWYLDRDSYVSRAWRRVGGVCLLATVVVSAVFFYRPGIGTAFGGFAAVWALAESADLLLALRAARPAVPEDQLGEPADLVLAS